MLSYGILLVVGLILIILGIQFKRGKWLGILAGNILSDKPIEEQKKNAKGCANSIFFVAFFCILMGIFEWMNLNKRPLLIFLGIPFLIYALILIVFYIKHFIKYGE